jgi:hypothetical protein
MHILKTYYVKYIGIFLFLEIINGLIFGGYDVLLETVQAKNFQFIISVIVTILAASFISKYFHDIQEEQKQNQKTRDVKKCNMIVYMIKKNRIKSSKILPSEEDFTDNYGTSLTNFQLSLSYIQRIQDLIYANTNFIPPKSLSVILPLLSDFPIIHKEMLPVEILNERANAELCLSRLVELISTDENFCDCN